LASLPPTTRLDKLLWHAPKKLSDILSDHIAQDRSVFRVLNVHKVDTSVPSRIAVLGYFNNDRCISTDVLTFDVANKIADALLDTRNRLVCVYGVSGGGKTMAMMLASTRAAEKSPYELFVVYLPLQVQFIVDLDRFEKEWSEKLPIGEEPTNRPDLVTERDEEALEQLKTMLREYIPEEARTDVEADHEYFALIVLDEMGSQPYFVRALCALHAKRVARSTQNVCVRRSLIT
jgi:hypothetical protein